ncbi:unnamed protein product [Rotaria sp. Silwood2]|nr:unnamed protein product [Rotaria sp. Silwood2]CAF4742826.1 unnamed protein product [Rotaria sp. Silwood2]
MINVNNILHLFDNLVRRKYPLSSHTEPSSQDHELADQLFQLFDQLLNVAELQVDNIVTLDINAYYDDDDEEYQEENKNPIFYDIDGTKYSYDTMCAVVEYAKSHSFSSLRSRYKRIKSKQHLQRIRKYVKDDGTTFQKLQRIDEFVYAELVRARESYIPMHDFDIKRLAIKKAREINLNSFTASHHWILNFKHRHHISSRKITKLMTKHHLEDRNEILKSAENFVKTVNEMIPKYTEDHILNTDQSSFK